MPRTYVGLAAALLPLFAQAQSSDGWQSCSAMQDNQERLACFDRWTKAQPATTVSPAPAAAAPAAAGATAPAAAIPAPAPAAPAALAPGLAAPAAALPAAAAGSEADAATHYKFRGLRLTAREGCRNAESQLSRIWELEPDSDCGLFGLRGYRPISLSAVHADTVNRQPTSGNPLNDAGSALDYQTTETRIQLSVRTKLAKNLLTRGSPDRSDSLWFGYTQQSYWQLFNPGLSRPFRSTDHEPELIYVLPFQTASKDSWRLRYGGLGVVHQSNGQSLPLSRSWNRAYLMLGAEKGDVQLNGRVWRRLPEDPATDDNPGIGNYVGRAEVRAAWQPSEKNVFAVTGRHSLHKEARGSVRLEWFRSLWEDGNKAGPGGLQLHTQVFTGYGDTLLDYNRRRTVFSIGLSLVDW